MNDAPASPPAHAGSASRRLGPLGWALVAGCVLAAVAARLLYHNPTIHFDEAFHLLAARWWVNEGTLVLTPGGEPYTRARLYTYLVGLAYLLFGDSLWVSRLPSVFFGVVLVGVAVGWVTRRAGLWAGLVVGIWLTIDGDWINFSTMTRFYIMQAALTFIGAALVYEATDRPFNPRRTPLLWAGAAASLALAASVQLTTLLLIVPLLTWWALRRGEQARRAGRRRLSRGYTLGLAAVLALLVVAGVAVWTLGPGPAWWEAFRSTQLRGHYDRESEFGYYFRYYLEQHGVWAWGFPLFLGAAVLWRPRLTGFCLLLGLPTLLALSLAGQKATRYPLFILPFLMLIPAVGFGALVEGAWRLLRKTLPPRHPDLQANSPHRGRGWGRGRTLTLALAGCLVLGVGYSFYRSAGGFRGYRMVAFDDPGPFVYPDWDAAVPVLDPVARGVDCVFTTAGPVALYHLGRHDVGLGNPLWGEPEFWVDWRTNAPTLFTVESMKKVMTEHSTGLIISLESHWRAVEAIEDPLADYIEAHARPLPLPEGCRLIAYVWGEPGIDQ